MQIKIFTIPVIGSEDFTIEFNKFLNSNKIIDIQQNFSSDLGGYWTFCVRYINNSPISGSSTKEKIDYKNVLSEKDFMVFSKLRELRKEIAVADAVPAYAVFTDEELSKIVQLDSITVM